MSGVAERDICWKSSRSRRSFSTRALPLIISSSSYSERVKRFVQSEFSVACSLPSDGAAAVVGVGVICLNEGIGWGCFGRCCVGTADGGAGSARWVVRPRLLLRLRLNDRSLSRIDLSTSLARLLSLMLRLSFISSSAAHFFSSRARSFRPRHMNQPTAALPTMPVKPKAPMIMYAALLPPFALYSCARTAQKTMLAVRAMRLSSNIAEATPSKILCFLSRTLWLRGRSLRDDGAMEALARWERASSV